MQTSGSSLFSLVLPSRRVWRCSMHPTQAVVAVGGYEPDMVYIIDIAARKQVLPHLWSCSA